MKTTQEQLLTVVEIAEYLRKSGASIRHLCRTGKLPHVKVGGEYRFRLSSIEAWLRDNEVTPK